MTSSPVLDKIRARRAAAEAEEASIVTPDWAIRGYTAEERAEHAARWVTNQFPGATVIPTPAPVRTAPDAATERQISYIKSLADERGMSIDTENLTKRAASAMIDRLRQIPRQAPAKTSQAKPATSVPAGSYAVENAEGVLRFYDVDHGKGKWEGWIFLSVHASSERHPIKGAAKDAILAKIAEDPRAAAVRYGHETNRCCICHRELTDAASREAGIGPVCAEGAGW